MIICPARLRQDGDSAVLAAEVRFDSGTESVWYSVNRRYESGLVTDRLDGFLVALLPLAMKRGESIELQAPISEKLYYNLTKYYQCILQKEVPTLKRVSIHPNSLVSGAGFRCAGAVGTGLSGGVDSFSAYYDHAGDEVPKSYRISHLVTNNVGGHAPGEAGRTLFAKRCKTFTAVVAQWGKEYVIVDSNLDEVFRGKFGLFQRTDAYITPLHLSVVLALGHLFSKYYFASGSNYEECFVGETYNSAFSDPFTLPLLSTETTEMIFTGAQYTRREKFTRLLKEPLVRRYLNVCTSLQTERWNCSKCEKCGRALLTAEALGYLPEMKEAFDLDTYRLYRDYFISTALGSQYFLWREIAALMEEKGMVYHPIRRTALYRHLRKLVSSIRRRAARH